MAKTKKISSANQKKLNSATVSREDKIKILKKYGLQNDAATLQKYNVNNTMTKSEINSLKSNYISMSNKLDILKKYNLQNNASVLKTYKVDQNAVPKPHDYEDEYKQTIDSLSKQLSGFNDNYDKYVSEYKPLVDSLQQSLINGTFYDPETDDRAKAYRNEYTRGAEQSRDSTMARLAAMNGGLGSTSITAAAQQAYDNKMGQLATKILDLRDLAEQSVRNNIYSLRESEADAYNKYNDEYTKAYKNLTDALNNYRGLSDTQRSRYQEDLKSWENYRAYLEQKRQFDEDLAYKYAALESRASASGAVGGGGGSRSGSGSGSGSGGVSGNEPVQKAVGSKTVSDGFVVDRYNGEKEGNVRGYDYTNQNTLKDYPWK